MLPRARRSGDLRFQCARFELGDALRGDFELLRALDFAVQSVQFGARGGFRFARRGGFFAANRKTWISNRCFSIMRYAALALALLLLLLPLSGCSAPQPAPAVLTIDPAPQQTILGWGVYPCTIRNDRVNAELYTLWHRPNAARLIWRDLHPTFWRCEILPGSYDARRDDGSLDVKYLDESLGRQIRLGRSYGQTRYILSVWSPPAPFKSPPTTLGVDPKTKRAAVLKPAREGDYCRFVARVLKQLQTEKLPIPFALSVQNEPDYAAPLWNGTQLTPTQWARLVVKMRAVLDENGFGKVQIIGPDAGNYADSIAFVGGAKAPILADAKLNQALGGFAFHGYTPLSKYAPHPQNLRAVALQMQGAGKTIWQSEWSQPGDKPDPLVHVLETAQRLGRETATIPCNYWSWWQGWYFRHPKGEVLLTGSDDAHLNISKTFTFLSCLWKNAPAGSVVHRVASNDAELSGDDAEKVQCVAFENPKNQTLLLVNPTSNVKEVQLRGLKGRAATPYLTDKARDVAPQNALAIKGGAANWNLPPRCVCVMVAQ